MKLTDVFEQYMIDCENKGRADRTLVLYRRDIGLLIRWLAQHKVFDLESVTVALLRQFLNYLLNSGSEDRFPNATVKGRLSPCTVGTYVVVIKAFFKWCYDEEILSSNPASRLKKPKVPKKITPTFANPQLDALLAICDQSTELGFRNYVIVLVLLDTGMRVSELCDLRLSNVYPRYVKVCGKGQKEREIGLHPDVSKLLWKYINKYRVGPYVEDDHVFLGRRGPLKVAAVQTMFRHLEEESGIADVRVSPHTLRHTFSKRYLASGGELFKLSRELGHSSMQTTADIYLGDFQSTEARQDHNGHSPINDMRLGKANKRKKENKDT